MAATLSTRSCSELWNDSHCVSTSGLAKRSVRQKCWRKWAQVAAGRFAIVELDTNALESVLPLPIAAGCPASECCPELAHAAKPDRGLQVLDAILALGGGTVDTELRLHMPAMFSQISYRFCKYGETVLLAVFHPLQTSANTAPHVAVRAPRRLSVPAHRPRHKRRAAWSRSSRPTSTGACRRT